MTRIKMCGLRRDEDIAAAGELLPEFIGFVFFPGSRRCVTPDAAAALRRKLSPDITAVGVFVDESPETVARLLEGGIIDMAQLHGHEDAAYIARLRQLTDRPLIQAFRIRSAADAEAATASPADHILLDAGAGDGKTFDWNLLSGLSRPYFLAGGLNPENVSAAVRDLRPWAVDVSSGIETDGYKDITKMRAFVRAVRERDDVS
ncbi:MAG: phosphoribosylanthranilate isomerase [Clostridiales bacterium]|nr:phosphoribosylanthranilate isomerase [Clostridiales bacterium]